MKLSVKDYRKMVAKREGKNKYNAKGRYYNGDYYHSTGEAKHAAKLDLQKKIGEIHDWERQVKIEIPINGKLWRTWTIDFKVWVTADRYEFHEYKGLELEDFKMKWDAIMLQKEELFPDVEFKLIKA